MSQTRGSARFRPRALAVLLLVSGLLSAGLVSLHDLRKSAMARQALAQGSAAVARQDWPMACRHLKRYLSKSPDDVEILELYARAQLAVRPSAPENLGAAIGALRRRLRLRPDDLATARQLIKLYTRTSQFEQAAYVFERLGATEDVQATLWWARARIAQRKFSEAAPRLEALVQRRPETVDAYLLLSDIALRDTSDPARAAAQRWLDRAVEADPRSASARVKRAFFLRTERNAAGEARADLELAEQLAPDDPVVVRDLAEAWLGLNDPDRAAPHITALERLDAAALADTELDSAAFVLARCKLAARLALARDDPHAAGAAADRALGELDPARRSQFLPTAVELYVKAEQPADARRRLDEYRAAMREMGHHPADLWEPLEALDGLVLLAEQRTQEAAARLEALVARSPQDLHARRLLALAYEGLGQPRRAARAWEEYAARAPGDAAVLLRVAQAYAHRDWSKAFRFARAAQGAGADDAEARLLEIEAALESGERLDAAQLAQFAADVPTTRGSRPNSARLQTLAARIAVRQGNLDAALTGLEQALDDTDDPTTVALQLARLYADGGQTDRAIAVAETAVGRRRDVAAPRLSLSELQQTAGRADAAHETLLKAARELDGDERAYAQSALARWLLLQGERPAGIELLTRLEAEHPHDIGPRLVLLSLPEVQADATESARLIDALHRSEGDQGLNWQVEQAALWLRGTAWRERATSTVETLSACTSADPGWLAPVLLLGSLHERLGKHGEAERVYRRAIESDRRDFRAANQLLDLLERQGRFADADDLLQRLPPDLPALTQHRVDVAIGRRNYDVAIRLLQDLVAADPRDAASSILLARLVFATRRDVGAAFKWLDRAAAAKPDLPSILPARVAILHNAERRDEALALLDEQVRVRGDFRSFLLRADYSSVLGRAEEAEQDFIHLTTFAESIGDGYAALGSFYQRTGRANEAVGAWQNGLSAAPDHAGLQRLLARRWATSDDASERARANLYLDRLLTLSPDEPELLSQRASLLLAGATPEANAEAQRVLERLIALAPQQAPAHLALVRLARERGDRLAAFERITAGLAANPADPDLTLESARIEADLGNFGTAKRLARFVIDGDSRNLPAHQLLVGLALRSGDLVGARAYNQAALQLDAGDLPSRVAQAEILAREGRRAEAVTALEQLRQSPGAPPRVDVLLLLADFYRQDGDVEHSGERLDEAARVAPRDTQVAAARMSWLNAQRRFDDIAALTVEPPGGPPVAPELLRRAANLLTQSGQEPYVRLAGSLFDRLIALDPKRIDGYIGRAQVAYRLKDLDAAEAAYQHVLTLDAGHPQTLNDLAWIIGHDRGQPERGLDFASRAVLRYPDDPHLLDTRGVLLATLGRHEEARRDLQRAVNLAAALPQTRAAALLHLGRVCTQLRQLDAARQAFTAAEQIDREHDLLTEAERAELRRTTAPP